MSKQHNPGRCWRQGEACELVWRRAPGQEWRDPLQLQPGSNGCYSGHLQETQVTHRREGDTHMRTESAHTTHGETRGGACVCVCVCVCVSVSVSVCVNVCV